MSQHDDAAPPPSEPRGLPWVPVRRRRTWCIFALALATAACAEDDPGTSPQVDDTQPSATTGLPEDTSHQVDPFTEDDFGRVELVALEPRSGFECSQFVGAPETALYEDPNRVVQIQVFADHEAARQAQQAWVDAVDYVVANGPLSCGNDFGLTLPAKVTPLTDNSYRVAVSVAPTGVMLNRVLTLCRNAVISSESAYAAEADAIIEQLGGC